MEGSNSALWRAMGKGDYNLANQLICSGVDVNEPNVLCVHPDISLLHYATMIKDIQLIRLLIKHGANCNALDGLKRTPLHWAVKDRANDDHPDIVDELINEGAIVDARNIYELTPLLMAASKGYYESAEKLIARGASIEAVDIAGWSALHLATVFKDLRMIKLLISHKINIDAEDLSGNTALHLAVEDTDIVRLLLDNGADLNKKQNMGEFPLYMAANKNCMASVHLLLERGVRINEVDDAGNTALHVACMRGFKDVAVLLVNFGADVNAPNRRCKTALQLMLSRNNPVLEEVARTLIREAIKDEALGHPICKAYRRMTQAGQPYSKFAQECREEIKRMRSVRIDVGDSAVSFYDIFSKNEEKLALLAKNKNIVTAFEACDYLALFGEYAKDLTTKFEKAKRWANYLISIEDCLVDVLGDVLPAPILEKIAAHVGYDDIIKS